MLPRRPKSVLMRAPPCGRPADTPAPRLCCCPDRAMASHPAAMNWKELCRLAQETVDRTRAKLPAEIRVLAEQLPVSLETFPEGPMLEDENVEPDILGLFVGPHHGQEATAEPGPPPQILLFLENLWDETDGDLARYREEVRITYLHELGHYLGWGEDEVARRGLA